MMRILRLIVFTLLLGSCANPTSTTSTADPFETLSTAEHSCPDFARASRKPLGTAADLAAIREAIRHHTHEAGIVGEIRWVSKTRVVAAVVIHPYANLGRSDYCCRLRCGSDGRWVVTDFEMTVIA